MLSLDQQVAEAEGYYKLLQEQVHVLSTAMNSTEEAEQLRGTAKNMLEALRQCICIIKESELTETNVISGPNSLGPTPPPPETTPVSIGEVEVSRGEIELSRGAVEAGPMVSAGSEGVQRSPAVGARGGETTGGDLR